VHLEDHLVVPADFMNEENLHNIENCWLLQAGMKCNEFRYLIRRLVINNTMSKSILNSSGGLTGSDRLASAMLGAQS
jgi:hypothetical protein